MRRDMVVAFLFWVSFSTVAHAQTPDSGPQATDIAALRAQIDALKADYEKRIHDLETQLEDIQAKMLQMPEPGAAQPIVAPAAPTLFGALNPAIAVAANFLGNAANQKAYLADGVTRIDNNMNLREAEVDMRVPIDPYSDGVLITSLGSESPGEFSAEIEEAYVNIKKLPFVETPFGSKFQVGRFRPSFGKSNTLHTHDLPQSTRSLVTDEFLGSEGFVSQGVSTDFFVPTPWDDNESLNGKVQVLTGGGVNLSPDNTQNRIAYLGTLRWFKTFSGTHNAELAWSSYWHPGNAATPVARMHDLDFMYRWKPFRQGEWRSYLLGGEMMFTDHEQPGASEPPVVASNVTPNLQTNRHPLGVSVFTQWQFDRRKYAGVRWDYTDTLIDPTLQRKSLTPYLSYYFSEFLRLRLDYEHRWSDITAENKRNTFFVELNWIFGAHPPEPFWVNR
jgi:hypothetical protein